MLKRGIYILLASTFLSVQTTVAETTFTLATTHAHHNVEEGYAGDIDALYRERDQRRQQIGEMSQNAPVMILRTNPDEGDRHPSHAQQVIVSDIRTTLYSDHDHDGYYSNFSLTFDVDAYYGEEYVFAKIYLRKPHANYELLHTTSVFEIYDDLSSDKYRVEIKLDRNFTASHYDVRIEIFVAGNSTVQDVVDAASHLSLHSLPLEADEFDSHGYGGTTTNDAIVHEYAGATSIGTLALLFIGIFGNYRLVRKYRRR